MSGTDTERGRQRVRLAITGLVSVLLLTGAAAARAEPPQQNAKRDYVATLVAILDLHAQAIRQLTEEPNRYDDNLSRHAMAIQRTFGLLGPMEWHAEKSELLHRRNRSGPRIDPESFDRLAENSAHLLKELYTTAHREMKEEQRGITLKALAAVQDSCKQCHGLMPEGATPKIWNIPALPGQ